MSDLVLFIQYCLIDSLQRDGRTELEKGEEFLMLLSVSLSEEKLQKNSFAAKWPLLWLMQSNGGRHKVASLKKRRIGHVAQTLILSAF